MTLLIESPTESTLGELLRRLAERRGEHPFIRFEERVIRYREADALCNRIGNGLLARGLGKGTHVALLMDNSPETLLTLLALGRIGAVSVPLNTAARGAQLRYFIEQSETRAIILDEAHVGRLDEALAGDERPRIVLRGARRPAGLPADPPADLRAGDTDFLDLLAAAESDPGVTVAFHDPAMLLYTSGTTGPSKACIYTQIHALHWAAGFARGLRYRPDDVMYVCLPLFHINAMQSASIAMMLVGGTVAIARRFSASGFWPDIVRHQATLTNLLGAMGDILWKLPPSDAERANTLRQWMMAPVPANAREAMARYRIAHVTNGYGLTDFGITHFYGPDDPPDKLGSVGRSTEAFEAQVVDELDFPVPAGKIGEIVLRNRLPWHGAAGYYRMPEKTAESRRNLWFHTGDLGYLDADGYLYFTDRKKDSIRRRGENISAFEVESVLVGHPEIREACVHAVSVDHDEEVGVTVVPVRPGAVDPAALVAWCNDRMAYFMVPRFVRFVDALPRNASEKIERHRLRSEMEASLAGVWDRLAAGIELRR